MPKVFEVRYSFKCPVPECLQPTAHMITVNADSAVDARDLAVTGLVCERCGKSLPKSYFVQTKVTEIK
jgi:hypothetical protein